jgi:hypothetical protein
VLKAKLILEVCLWSQKGFLNGYIKPNSVVGRIGYEWKTAVSKGLLCCEWLMWLNGVAAWSAGLPLHFI